jgi:competence protein ComEC
MTAAYDLDHPATGQSVSDGAVVVLAAVTVLAVWQGISATTAVVTLAAAVAGCWLVRRPLLVAVAVVLAVAGAVLSQRAWDAATAPVLGPFRGWATLATDPQPRGNSVHVVLEMDGQRFEAFLYGSSSWQLGRRAAGERVLVEARRVPLPADRARRAQARHIVGRFEIDQVFLDAPGSPLATSANRVRDTLRSGAEAVMPANDAALFTGLVIGDDSRQPSAMIDAFRAAGLIHLTAVSGQNVGFTLAVFGVMLRRLRPWWRLGATWAVIAWFVVVTRVEPSVVRAGVMASMSAWGFALGRERSPLRMLALAVIVLVLVDPLLVWSVGFWLSVTATAGVTAAAPRIERRLGGPRWLAAPLAVTLGAQLGVLLPSWLVFGRMPSLGVVANMLAVPVAGVVMLIGIPAAMVAAVVPHWLAVVAMAPAAWGTRWVRAVAELSARLEPHGLVAATVWSVQLAVVLALVMHGRARAAEPDARR